MSDFFPGDLAQMNFMGDSTIVTIVRRVPHPYLPTLSAYKVLDTNGKTHSVSQRFLKVVA